MQIDEWDNFRPSCYVVQSRKTTKGESSTYWEFTVSGSGADDALSNQNLTPFIPGENAWAGPARRWLPRGYIVQLQKPFDVEIRLTGLEITIVIDGTELTRSQYDRVPKGRVGFATNQYGSARFSDIEVTSPEGYLLWKGLPPLPN
jgi:hypothetical protein